MTDEQEGMLGYCLACDAIGQGHLVPAPPEPERCDCALCSNFRARRPGWDGTR